MFRQEALYPAYALLLASYVLIKFVQRDRFLGNLRVARITPEELKNRLDIGDETLAVVDTRSILDVDAVPYAIPGAIWIAAEDIARRQGELPRGREIVLYCSLPNEATSARVAL